MKSEMLMAQKKTINLGSKASKATGSKSSASAPVKAKKVAQSAEKPTALKATAKFAKASAPQVQAAKAAAPKSTVKSSAKPAPKAQVKPAVGKSAHQAKAAPAKSATAHKAAPAKVAAHAARPAAPVRAMTAAVDNTQSPKITGPAPAATAAPAKSVAKPAAAAEKKVDKPAASVKHGFKVNEYVVYPTQGVGKVIGIEEEEIAGMKLELFKIEFEKERLVLRVPMGKVQSVGMRKLVDDATVKRALDTLKGRARIKRTMWSRRAQEYVAKINSGDLFAIAEVVRDLYRSEAQPEQSYSERQLYEDALERMAREVALVERLDERGAVQRITEILAKSAKGRAASPDGAGGDSDAKAA